MKALTRRELLKFGGTALAGAAVGQVTHLFSGGGNPQPVPTPQAGASVARAPVPVGQPGTPVWMAPNLSGRELLIWGLEYDPHIEAYYRLAKKFQEYTGLESFEVQPQGWPIEDNVITGMAAGLVPDAVCIMGKQISPLVDEGALLNLDPMYDELGVNLNTWFGPVGRDCYTRNGSIYGVPVEGNCTSGVVNVLLDEVKRLGLESMWPPLNGKVGFDSFEDMWGLAEALMEKDGDGNVTRWGLSGEGWYANQLLGIILTLGGQYYTNGKVTLDTPEAEEAMRLLAYTTIFDLGIETHLGTGGQENMNANRAAMAAGNVTGTPSGLSLDPPINIDTCLYPSAVPGKTPQYVGEGGWGFVATSQGKNSDVALEFMKFLTTYEGNATYCEIYGGIVSSVIAVNSDEVLFPPGTLLGDSMARGGIAQQYTKFYNVGNHNPADLVSALNAATEAVRVGELSPKQAVKQAQKQVEEASEL